MTLEPQDICPCGNVNCPGCTPKKDQPTSVMKLVWQLKSRIKYLEKIIEDNLKPEEVEHDGIGFGAILVCPICEEEMDNTFGTKPVNHKPWCYWSEE